MTADFSKERFAVPLQNRVDPFGTVQATSERGLYTGNRGIIHDPRTKTLLRRRWTMKAWIICTLEHPRGTRRDPMGCNGRGDRAGWTELFFLDEVTALAAGHRPCFYCRREAAKHFQRCFAPQEGELPSAPAMDEAMHRERTATKPFIDTKEMTSLPDGTMIAVDSRPFALKDGTALTWSFGGYGRAQRLPDRAALLTPPSTVAALRNGYQALWHPSAG
jgi:hypothetical protein